ncbi:MAG: Putative secreted protein [uncultured Sulfurovum sp.]|uniref:Secreted protein n=1 Tax=uncultured Sulfurovum sp. TaxID=269237 RepID=A0A6S6U2T8_9BACT|nr:MAG: Putative secreted protein [uncultured Sulfurovum sp.]
MKNKKLLNISILTTLFFFSACSNSQNELQANTASVYNIMGITEATQPIIQPTEAIPNDISYVSYKKTNNFYQAKQNVIENIEQNAKSFLGVPYVWGATGPNKFDCSGFTQWVYRDAGINIPRVSRDQARVGHFISYDNLQRGDMVFFDTKKKRTGRVSHVGIYLGNGDFIHASSAGKSVVIYNFNEKQFYKKRFLWGRRVLKPDFHYALN